MASEDRDILEKIGQLAGQINRHKNSQQLGQQTQLQPSSRTNTIPSYPQASRGWRSNCGHYTPRGYARGGRQPQVHRNRTLVLKSNTPASSGQDATISTEENKITPSQTTNAAPAWVSKTDRHLQLINTSIFEKNSQDRAKAMEETRKQKLKQRDERERNKFARHLQRMSGGNHTTGGSSVSAAANYEINVEGIIFRVAKNGCKLVKVPGEGLWTAAACVEAGQSELTTGLPSIGDLNAAKSSPKTALVGGVRFYRSKNGNMYRSGTIKAHRYGRLAFYTEIDHPVSANMLNARRIGVIKKINEPCKMFTTTGSCTKGPRCRYIHDASKVAVCKDFLLKGSCPSGDSCDLSHELSPERTPTCMHFAKGNCANPNCRYTHVRVSPAAHVCRSFGIYGYCENGSSCQERHVHECPDFSNTGTCNTKGCKLPHRHKASVMRTNVSSGDNPSDDANVDVSSDDEDEEIDSDDVDSDDLDEEFFGDLEGERDTDIPMQKDYVQLS